MQTNRDVQNMLDKAGGVPEPQTAVDIEKSLQAELSQIKTLEEFKHLDIQLNKMATTTAYYAAKYSNHLNPELLELLVDWDGGLRGLMERTNDSEQYKNLVFTTATKHASESTGLAQLERSKEAVKLLAQLAEEGWMRNSQIEGLIEESRYKDQSQPMYADWIFEVACKAENLSKVQLMKLVRSEGGGDRMFSAWPKLAGHAKADKEVWEAMFSLVAVNKRLVLYKLWTQVMQHQGAWQDKVWVEKLRNCEPKTKCEVAMHLLQAESEDLRPEWEVDELMEWIVGVSKREDNVAYLVAHLKPQVIKRLSKKGKALLLGARNKEVRVAAIKVLGQEAQNSVGEASQTKQGL